MQEYSQRQLKVAEQLKRILSDAFNRERIFAHVIGEVYVIISEIRISPDLKNATAYIMPSGVMDAGEVVKILDKENSLIKRYISKQNLSLKYIPNFKLKYDDSYDKAKEVGELINGIHKEEN